MIVFWGIGKFLEKEMDWIRNIYDVKYLTDNDCSKWGKYFYGIRCISPDEVQDMDCEVVITAENTCAYNQIKDDLRRRNIREHKMYNGKSPAKKLLIWGAPSEYRKMHILLGENQSDYEVYGYVTILVEEIGTDGFKNIPIISLFKAEKMLLNNEIDGIVAIADEMNFDYLTRENVTELVLENDHYYVSRKNIMNKYIYKQEKFDLENIILPYKKYCRVRSLQLNIIAKCNLNCRLCSHFAALVDEDEIYTYEEFASDVERAAELIEDVDNIDIFGGEPFLCDFLPQALYKVHKEFSRAQLYIGTNGLRILSMSDELLKAIKETNAIIVISMYEPTTNIIDDIVKYLKTNNIEFIRGKGRLRADTFSRRYDVNGSHDIKTAYGVCECKFFPNIYKGKISECFFPVMVPFFNKKFDSKFDVEEDVLNLHDAALTREELIKRFRNPMKACRYCAPHIFEPWGQASVEPTIDDWVFH